MSEKDPKEQTPEEVAQELENVEAEELDDRGMENVSGGAEFENAQTLFDNCNC